MPPNHSFSAPAEPPLIVEERFFPLIGGESLRLKIVREDKAHPVGMGNKFWKLRRNLLRARENGHDTLLSFGGAWSNHIHATAWLGCAEGFKTIGVIRGEKPPALSPTLQFAQTQGMRLHFVSREAYRQKETPDFEETLRKLFGRFHMIPEGGANRDGFDGVSGWASRLKGLSDIICLAAGTGTTAAALAHALPDSAIMAFSALKGGEFLRARAEQMAQAPLPNLSLITDYHFGGYAKETDTLRSFITQMAQENNLPLDPVYTAKTLFGIIDLAHRKYFPPDKTIALIHTGGLQEFPPQMNLSQKIRGN